MKMKTLLGTSRNAWTRGASARDGLDREVLPRECLARKWDLDGAWLACYGEDPKRWEAYEKLVSTMKKMFPGSTKLESFNDISDYTAVMKLLNKANV